MLLKVGRTVHPGSWSKTSSRNKRTCRLSPAHQGVKIKVLIVGVVCGSFATHTPPLDSRLRGNDELGGGNDELGGGNDDTGG